MFRETNGAGKTTILDAAAAALSAFLELLEVPARFELRPLDAHRVWQKDESGNVELVAEGPTEVTAVAWMDGREIRWTQSRSLADQTTTDSRELGEVASALVSGVAAGCPVDLPLVAYYRRDPGPQTPLEGGGGDSRWDGYLRAFTPCSLDLITDWMRRKTRSQSRDELESVERAVCQCLPPADGFRFNLETDGLELHFGRSKKIVPFQFLGDAMRTVVGTAADLACRACMLNPHLGGEAVLKARGVVLIDDVEEHLERERERSIVSRYLEAFPGLQLIASTNSLAVSDKCR